MKVAIFMFAVILILSALMIPPVTETSLNKQDLPIWHRYEIKMLMVIILFCLPGHMLKNVTISMVICPFPQLFCSRSSLGSGLGLRFIKPNRKSNMKPILTLGPTIWFEKNEGTSWIFGSTWPSLQNYIHKLTSLTK